MRPKIVPFLAIAFVCVAAPAANAAAAQPVTFQYTGAEQSYTVPAGVTDIHVVAIGAPGGAGNFGPHIPRITGGVGAEVTGDLAVRPGEVVFVEVGGPGGDGDANGGGGPGFNGGGPGGSSGGGGALGGGGGGASDVRRCSTSATSCDSAASRLLVAGGGGGGGGAELNDTYGGQGGDAGQVGSPGYTQSGGGGGGATQSAGGAGGIGGLCAVPTSSGMSGTDGGLGTGGVGGYGVAGQDDAWGGGGGGGYYGGGGGGDGCEAGGGGGGSSYGPAGTTFATAVRGAETPFITITPLEAGAQVSTATLSFASQALSTVSLPQTVTVTNTGNAPLTISGLTFAGAANNDFLVGSSSCGGNIAPSASCQLTVRFAPSASGVRMATLDITSNDPAGPAGVQLSGTGAQPSPSAGSPAGTPGTTGAPGTSGTSGTPGTPGATGATGAPSASGSPTHQTLGTVELLSCQIRTLRVHSRNGTATRRVTSCSRRSLSANARFVVTPTPTRATLAKRGVVYASGVSSRRVLVLRSQRAISAGVYTLTLAYGNHRTTVKVTVR